jgi:hypothetical protein
MFYSPGVVLGPQVEFFSSGFAGLKITESDFRHAG